MNKKMIFVAIVAVAAVSSIIGFNTQQQGSNVSALTLANVEALTSGETVSKNCPGGSNECARITTSPGRVHIFYEE